MMIKIMIKMVEFVSQTLYVFTLVLLQFTKQPKLSGKVPPALLENSQKCVKGTSPLVPLSAFGKLDVQSASNSGHIFHITQTF